MTDSFGGSAHPPISVDRHHSQTVKELDRLEVTQNRREQQILDLESQAFILAGEMKDGGRMMHLQAGKPVV